MRKRPRPRRPSVSRGRGRCICQVDSSAKAALRGGWKSSAAREKTRVGPDGGGKPSPGLGYSVRRARGERPYAEWHIFYNTREKRPGHPEGRPGPIGRDIQDRGYDLLRTPSRRSSPTGRIAPVRATWGFRAAARVHSIVRGSRDGSPRSWRQPFLSPSPSAWPQEASRLPRREATPQAILPQSRQPLLVLACQLGPRPPAAYP
jgi:hypothetical protein